MYFSSAQIEEFYERYLFAVCSVCFLSNMNYRSTCSSLQHLSFSDNLAFWFSLEIIIKYELFFSDVEGFHIPSSGISARNVPLPPRILMISCAAVGRALPAGSGWESFSSAYGKATAGSAVPSSGLLNTRETWTYWVGCRDSFGTRASLLWRKAERARTVQPGLEKGDFINK